MLALEYIHGHNLFLLALLRLSRGRQRRLIHLLWGYIVQSLLDYIVHVEEFQVLVTVLRHELRAYRLLASECPAKDGNLDRQVRGDLAYESFLVSLIRRLLNLLVFLVLDSHLGAAHAPHHRLSLLVIYALYDFAKGLVLDQMPATML